MGTSKISLISGVYIILGLYTFAFNNSDETVSKLAYTAGNQTQAEQLAKTGLSLALLKLYSYNPSTNYSYTYFSTQNASSMGGSVTYNVLQAQNVYLTDKANFLNQEMMVRNTVRNLNYMMGVEPSQTWDFTESFEADTSAYVMADLLSKMKSDNQSLKNQYTNLLLKENETSLQNSAYYPSISLGAGMDYGHTWGYSGGAQYLNNATLTPYGNVRLSFDIYSAGVRRRGVEIARINEEVAQVQIDQIEHALTNELFNLFDFHEVRLELLNVANENLGAAELNLSISEEKYRSGVINSFNYRDIQLIYLSVAYQRLQAVYNLIASKAALTRITGGFLGYASE